MSKYVNSTLILKLEAVWDWSSHQSVMGQHSDGFLLFCFFFFIIFVIRQLLFFPRFCKYTSCKPLLPIHSATILLKFWEPYYDLIQTWSFLVSTNSQDFVFMNFFSEHFMERHPIYTHDQLWSTWKYFFSKEKLKTWVIIS